MGFTHFQFNAKIYSALEKQGFTTPTPIQTEAIPHVMNGKDIMGLAQTGTGKTAAFVLPMIERFSKSRANHVRGLIIAPTRELAEQINEVVKVFGNALGIHSITAYGGASMGRQVEGFRRGVDIVVACPGRLLDHIERRTVDLSKIEMLVLDEADQMFDMGFIPTIRKILGRLPQEKQTLLFSATMPNHIRRLAEDILKNPISVKVGTGAPTTTVSHAIYPVPQHLKTPLLIQLLQHTDTDSVLIFTRTKHRAKKIAQVLDGKGFSVTSLQGNLSQSRRMEAMKGFRSGQYQIMVATDIAARGVDISTISHVINYDIPDTVEAYTHRIGRTGRAANTGDALTLVTGEDREMVVIIERVLRATLERRTLPDFDYKAVASESPRNDSSRGSFRRPEPRGRSNDRGYRPRRNNNGGGRRAEYREQAR